MAKSTKKTDKELSYAELITQKMSLKESTWICAVQWLHPM